MTNTSMDNLESIVEQLMERCRTLKEQNERLINTHEQWMEERRRLFQKIENADDCIEQTIVRLASIKGTE